MAVCIVEHEISVVISDDEESDEMIIDFEILPSIGVTSKNEGHEKPDERNFGSQSRPVSWQHFSCVLFQPQMTKLHGC